MKNETEGRKNISGLIVLLVLGIFAVCVIGVLLAGVETYTGINERDQETFNERTCAQYITTKIRQTEDHELIKVEEYDGGAALCFTEYIDGEEYNVYLYSYDGWLCEYYGSADAGGIQEGADFGEKLLPLAGFVPQIEDGMLNISLKFENDVHQDKDIDLNIYLRQGEGEQYEE